MRREIRVREIARDMREVDGKHVLRIDTEERWLTERSTEKHVGGGEERNDTKENREQTLQPRRWDPTQR